MIAPIKKWGGSLLLSSLFFISHAQSFTPAEISRWEKRASATNIIRDKWGIAHVMGKTDADAVFGLLYAQCEDDFPRVEMNYIEKLGRMAEVTGEKDLYEDLLIRLIIDTADAKKDFQTAPVWLKSLLQAYADGINYYLYKHPGVRPALLQKFEPWFPLLWTDGSIGAIDIAEITVNDLKKFYGKGAVALNTDTKKTDPPTDGSNGFAFAPSITESGNAILYINPHTTFYFRPEISMQSDEGLHVYGAVTWGQFFIYQGFNEHCGWMHTSSYSDVADTYLEKVSKNEKGEWVYEYNGKTRPVSNRNITIYYTDKGVKKEKTFTGYFTHHGPVMSEKNGQWISVRANNRDIKGLIQSWQRTKATNFAAFNQAMSLLANTSNNTVYADDKGNIAYWHGNFMPKRNPAFNWQQPVDGSVIATEWQGLHTLNELITIKNPANGWIQNCNSSPFTAAGPLSPIKERFPKYMAPNGDNFRGIRAVQLLTPARKYNLDKVIETGYDTHLTAFDLLIPALEKAWRKGDTTEYLLRGVMQTLLSWDRRSSVNSVATTVAIEWAQKLWPVILKGNGDPEEDPDVVEKTKRFCDKADPNQMMVPLRSTIAELMRKFGSWEKPWGEVNRFQRLTGNIRESFDDNQPSIPCGFAASTWGSLPSYVSRSYPNTRFRYGNSGNSFVCAVEFGKKVKARSVLAGGVNGVPSSPYFNNQGEMYTKGEFKEVLFYKEDILNNAVKQYQPGKE
jgi:acyl-homoserine-lactone acylase